MSFKNNLSTGRTWSLPFTLLTALAVSFSSCKTEESTPPPPQTITQQINASSKFTLLKAALTKAGLDVTLGAAGTYTVFAPTDDAFKAFGLASETALALAPVDLLRSVLQYHVLGTKLETSAMPTATNTAQQTLLATLPLYITKTASASGTSTGAISVNGAHLILGQGATDVQASNGVIHSIDRILLPPLYGDIPKTIAQIPTIYALLAPTAGISFKLLQQAVTRAGTTVGGALSAAGPITVFAPTDNAFKASGFDSTKIANTPAAMLATVLSYHVVNGRLYTPTLTNGSSLTTAAGTITVATSATATTVTGKGNGTTASNVVGPDVTATNGVIQIIDRLLLPQ